METVQHFLAALWSTAMSGLVALGLMAAPAPASVQGYVEGEFLLISPNVGGILDILSVHRGGRVAEGDSLFILEQSNEKSARDQAAANLEQARSRLGNLGKGKRRPEVDVIAAQKLQAEAQLRLAQLEYDRQQRLVTSGASSRQQVEEAQATFEQQRARVAELAAQLDVAGMTMGRDDELRAAEGDISANTAALAQAQWKLDQKTVTAPTAALVADTYFNPGEMVVAGQPVVQLLPAGNIKVRFFVRETDLARFPVGAAVTVRCDGCAAAIPAIVRYVSPQAEYTPPVLYNRENRSKMVFMLEAWPTERPEALRPGQPVDVSVATPKSP